MTRIIDADTLRITFDGNHEYVEKSDIDDAPEVEAIPIEYIEAKKKTLHCLIEVEVKHGDMEEAFRLERIIAVMNAIISDWRYDTRLARRAERGEE